MTSAFYISHATCLLCKWHGLESECSKRTGEFARIFLVCPSCFKHRTRHRTNNACIVTYPVHAECGKWHAEGTPCGQTRVASANLPRPVEKAREWTPCKELLVGEINGLPTFRGTMTHTSEMLCRVRLQDGRDVEAHKDWFVVDKAEKEPRQTQKSQRQVIADLI